MGALALLAAAMIVLFLPATAAAGSLGSAWKVQAEFGGVLSSVEFIDSQHGWVSGREQSAVLPGGTQGVVYRTNDSGATWVKQVLDAGWVPSCEFHDELRGWAIGTGVNQTILRTSDGGTTWASSDVTVLARRSGIINRNEYLNSIRFIGTRRGWAVGGDEGQGPGIILRSVDGGVSWRTQMKTAEDLNSLFFSDSKRGWVVGDHGLVLSSSNGGRTWRRQSVPTSLRLVDVGFVDAQHGWILGSAGRRLGSVLTTSDGGATWRGHVVPLMLPRSLSLADARHGWVVGSPEGAIDARTIATTSDGGRTWSVVKTSVDAVSDVSATSSGQCWAAGVKGGRGVVLVLQEGNASAWPWVGAACAGAAAVAVVVALSRHLRRGLAQSSDRSPASRVDREVAVNR